jgi:hypothetical protein
MATPHVVEVFYALQVKDRPLHVAVVSRDRHALRTPMMNVSFVANVAIGLATAGKNPEGVDNNVSTIWRMTWHITQMTPKTTTHSHQWSNKKTECGADEHFNEARTKQNSRTVSYLVYTQSLTTAKVC